MNISAEPQGSGSSSSRNSCDSEKRVTKIYNCNNSKTAQELIESFVWVLCVVAMALLASDIVKLPI